MIYIKNGESFCVFVTKLQRTYRLDPPWVSIIPWNGDLQKRKCKIYKYIIYTLYTLYIYIYSVSIYIYYTYVYIYIYKILFCRLSLRFHYTCFESLQVRNEHVHSTITLMHHYVNQSRLLNISSKACLQLGHLTLTINWIYNSCN